MSKKYFPVVYGEFTESSSSPSAQDLSDGRDLYPAPIDNVSGKILSITPRSYDGTTYQDGRLHHFEKDSDQFVPIDDSGFTDSTESYQGGNAIRCKIDLQRGFKTKPKTTIATEWSNSDNSFDIRTDDSSTYSSDTITLNQAETTIEAKRRDLQQQYEMQGYSTEQAQSVSLQVANQERQMLSLQQEKENLQLEQQTYQTNAEHTAKVATARQLQILQLNQWSEKQSQGMKEPLNEQ